MRSAWSIAAVAALVACSGDGKDGLSPDIVLENANNFSYTGDLQIQETEVQAGVESCFDWSAMTTDIRGRALVPAEVEQVTFVEFALTKDEVIAEVNANTLLQSDSVTQWLWDNDSNATSVCMNDLEIVGNFFDPATYLLENAERTWLMSLVKLPEGRLDILTSRVVVPLETSTNTAIDLVDGNATLDIEADLHSAPPAETQEGVGPYTLDWSGVTEDVNGIAFDPLRGDQLLIAHYEADDVTPVEEQFLLLDEIATELYRLDVYGVTRADLEDATDSEGNAFGGFTADGLWLVGLSCTTCTSPVPLYISVIDVAAP